MRPKLFLVSVETLQGNRAMEWSSTTAGRPVAPERRRGQFWAWLVNLTREVGRGHLVRPGGRVGW